MMELVSVVAGIICGILAGVPTAILLLIVMTRFEQGQRKRREAANRPVTVQWGQSQTVRQFTIVERQMLEDGKRR